MKDAHLDKVYGGSYYSAKYMVANALMHHSKGSVVCVLLPDPTTSHPYPEGSWHAAVGEEETFLSPGSYVQLCLSRKGRFRGSSEGGPAEVDRGGCWDPVESLRAIHILRGLALWLCLWKQKGRKKRDDFARWLEAETLKLLRKDTKTQDLF